jgi:hypothetical protein
MSLTMEKELLASYAFHAGLCTVKMLGLSLLTAGYKIQANFRPTP